MQDKINLRWFRAIAILAIILTISISVGSVWPYLATGAIGMIAGYVFGFVGGLRDGENIAFAYLFGDDIASIYQDYVEGRLQDATDKRDDGLVIADLLERFRSSGVGGLAQLNIDRVKNETLAELERMRENGTN